MMGTGTTEDENRLLRGELRKVEDMLSQSRAEKDELSIKLNALSDKVSSHSVLLEIC